MDRANRYDGIDEYAAWLIRHKARQLVGSAGFSESDRDDLEQDLAFNLIVRLGKFDPKIAGRKTFIARVIEHKVASIIEERSAQKRDCRVSIESLNDRLAGEDDEIIERLEVFDMEKYLRQTGRLSRDSDERLGLSIDLERAMALLPPELRDMCERLQSESVAEISRDTGIPRGTIYEKIRRIRRLFEESGLKDYE